MNCINMQNITKSYDGFTLSPTSFSLPKGGKLVLVGGSGSGKTTLLRCLLGLTHPDGGHILLQEGESLEQFLLNTGVVWGDAYLPLHFTPKQMQRIFASHYAHWDKEKYAYCLVKLGLSPKKPLEFPWRARDCACACTLARYANFLVFDRPNPEKMEENLSFWEEGESRCLSLLQKETQIHTRDTVDNLPEGVTHLAFMRDGKVVLQGNREQLLINCGKVTCTAKEVHRFSKADYVRGRFKTSGNLEEKELLIPDRFAFFQKYPEIPLEEVTLGEICRFVLEGELYDK